MTLRLGLGLPQMPQYDPRRDVRDVARAAEETGFDSVWTFERALVPDEPLDGLYGTPGLPWPDFYRHCTDPLVTLALAAAVTDRVRLGTSVLVSGLHAPFPLARTLATLDAAGGGRVLAGFGTGWSQDEYRAAGVTAYPDRGAQMDELLDVCAAVWGPDPVAYRGRWTQIAPASVGPKPARPIPVYLAGSGGRALERVARRADGWLPGHVTGPQLALCLVKLKEAAARHGRDAGKLDVVLRVGVELTGAPLPEAGRRPYTGSPEQVLADLAGAAEAGAREVLLDLQTHCRDGAELADRAAELHGRVRAAGL
ncbi:TIGR03619 family F420-dependent LLM class oxidoreductase [Streptomyces sp. BHT-5-2]|uniref:TIGR03619 family F420-dependent LLM class oxidoreductase n=1 Tax=Streptomyces sp. BHT-5-2 TaxID=2866715 RepID=UPI001C8D400B|nr:TIGR03619 family F420-dependent LLM class oxidoreductase [Streptomyces sp. BHT-5-2]QZL05675.1 TIGR03619 family F420-dependent LLM class oxidoreductase [Streptomyces sp. BHT-5-2]